MFAYFNQKDASSNLFNLLVASFPISFIAGNMIININIVLLILSTLIIHGKCYLNTRYYFLDKIIFLFFSFIIFTALANDYFFFQEKLQWKGYFSTIIKSILFLKYLLLYLSLRILIENNILKLKLFFISCALSTLFVCFDLFYQGIYGQDVFGFEKPELGRKLGGPFDDELIAGGYIQRFSLFSFFLIPLFYKEKFSNFIKFIIPIFFVIFLSGIIISGNRMPLLLFVFTIFLVIIFQKQTRKYFFSFLILFSIIFSLIFTLNDTVKDNFYSFHHQIKNSYTAIKSQDFKNNNMPSYLKEFATFYDTWLLNKYIGGGIKNFRYYCHTRPNIEKNSKFICNMHPHNYYLEVLTETGLIGFIILINIFILILYLSFFKKYFSKSVLNNDIMIIPFIFLFITEIFPLKSTGSFFTTGNSTYLFLIIGIMIGLIRRKNFIENNN